MLPVRQHRGVPDRLDAMYRPPGMHSSNRCLNLVDQPRVLVIAGDPKRVDLLLQRRQTAVAEIQPSKCANEAGRQASPPSTAGNRSGIETGRRPVPPVTESSPTHPKPLAHRVQTLTGRDRSPSQPRIRASYMTGHAVSDHRQFRVPNGTSQPNPLGVRLSLPLCPEWDSNPHWMLFESTASADWATRALCPKLSPSDGPVDDRGTPFARPISPRDGVRHAVDIFLFSWAPGKSNSPRPSRENCRWWWPRSVHGALQIAGDG